MILIKFPETRPMLIALDIETTGIDKEFDEIIEVAAVKFDRTGIIEEFQTLINPEIPIPEIASHITGITDEDVKDAPKIHEIRTKLLNFVGDAPIVGHFIQFDTGFLSEKGIPLPGIEYDSCELARILLPGHPSYSLETLTRTLDIPHTNAHRALDDTIASAHLFNILLEKINQIPDDTLKDIQTQVKKSHWKLKNLFLFPQEKPKIPKPPAIPTTIIPKTECDRFPKECFKQKRILEIFDPEGVASNHEVDYEVRPSQKEMTKHICSTFKNSKGLICEAGTGTGKSLSYLIPSLIWNLTHEEKVIISTHTKNLQDQLSKKDIPTAKKIVSDYFSQYLSDDEEMPEITHALLKGRKNYLSKNRLDLFMQKTFFEDHEISLLIKVLLWLPHTLEGCREELELVGKEKWSWSEICCDEYKCPHTHEDFKKNCYLMKARNRAQNADITIVNHALLFADALSESAVIPEYSHIVIDESHHIEDSATQAFTHTLVEKPLDEALYKIARESEKHKTLKHGPETAIEAENIRERLALLFGIVGMFFEKNAEHNSYERRIILEDHHYSTAEWKKAADSAENFCEKAEKFVQKLNDLIDELEKKELKEDASTLFDTSETIIEQVFFIRQTLLHPKPESMIVWLFQSQQGTLGCKSTPITIGDLLQEHLFDPAESVSLCSATLSINGTFNYIRSQLKLSERFDEISLPSHFSYPEQAKVVIPDDIPEPYNRQYQSICADVIEKIIRKNKGRTLVLFTSKKAIEMTYNAIAPSLKKDGINILAQGMSGGRGKIIENFKHDPEHSVLFGTDSFWEGIDIKGEDLNCVVIQKLPFKPPSDPIIFTRSQQYENGFTEYQVPLAILKFKQGFGRLIRSHRDTGTLIILDPRIYTKSYGQKFLNSLPEGIEISREI